MSQTVCIMTPPVTGRSQEISRLASELNIVISDEKQIDPEFKNGLLTFRSSTLPDSLIFLLGEDGDPADGWSLLNELVESRFVENQPRIFRFLEGIRDIIESDTSPSYFIAGDEWYLDDDVVFFAGPADELISFLRMNKSFYLYFRKAAGKVIDGVPRYPLLFQILPHDG